MKRLIVCFIMILATLISLTACKTDEDDGSGRGDIEDVENAHVHTPGEWIVDDQVTCYSNGHRHRECFECHEIVDSEIIYATGHNMKDGVCVLCGKSYSSALEYTSLGNGECYVSHIGGCTDTDILVPPTSPEGEKVVNIGNDAFRDCNEITSVELSEGIQEIRMYAFFGCQGLRNVILPNSIVDIDSYAFSDCRLLESVILGNSLETIGYEAFGFCESLKKIEIPASVAMIEKRAFVYCEALEAAKFEKGSRLSVIDDEAFRECKSLSEILIPDSVTKIGKCTFYECTSLGVAEIGNGVRVIEEYAFTESGIDILLLGSGLESIGYEAFGFCYNLDDVTIPASVTTIEKRAFIHCESLQTAKIEGGSRLSVIDDEAFRECKSLLEILVPDSMTEIGKCAFYGCASLGNVVIGNGVTVIDEYAFTESGIITLALGNSLEKIGYEAFGYCRKLKDVTIPASVTMIENRAFINCESLESVNFADGSKLTKIDDLSFSDCGKLLKVKIPDSVEEIGVSAFANCESLTDVVIGKNVRSIDNYAFENCYNLKNVDFGSVKEIGFSAFGNCKSLVSVKLGDSLKSVDKYAFDNCIYLSEIILPRTIEGIDEGAFSDCAKVTRIYYEGNPNEWDCVNLHGQSMSTPYYYYEYAPIPVGNYWYYNYDGEPRIWYVTKDAFHADYYQQNFIEDCMTDETLGSSILEIIEDEMMDTIVLWESLHFLSDPNYIFDINNSLISKYDLYKYVLYDILTGEHAEKTFADIFDNATAKLFMDAARVFLDEYDLSGLSIQEIADMLNKKDLKALSTKTFEFIKPGKVDAVEHIINLAGNVAEALQSISRYYAFQEIKAGYITLLREISDDGSNPWDLRAAAYDIVVCYEQAMECSPEEFVVGRFAEASALDICKWVQKKCLELFINSDPTGMLKSLNVGAKITSALLEPLGISGMVEGYYNLKCLTAIEKAAVSILGSDNRDYYRLENRELAGEYMESAEMLQKILILENQYILKFFYDYHYSAGTNESQQAYDELVSNVNFNTNLKTATFNTFASVTSKYYAKYYAV